MSEHRDQNSQAPPSDEETDFSRQVGMQAARKRRAQRREKRSAFFGLGMSGLIGWSVMVPTLVGAAIGVRLDRHFPGRISWTLTLLLTGLMIGCLSAWRWVRLEFQGIQEESDV